ncbi:hypothetical protein [Ornithinibacillus scapharcae]|uniref:hypothetical protein n=1 Tax=Ornithinibacillus scapharcae TaxID=1147159 RepID=UPI000225B628|nr:hypothetical protein [Ornithinibacillus scapharcae]
MKCGAKRYIVEAERNNEKQINSIIARTPAEARKKFRSTYGDQASIISVSEVKRRVII